jgi:hypothetical protein
MVAHSGPNLGTAPSTEKNCLTHMKEPKGPERARVIRVVLVPPAAKIPPEKIAISRPLVPLLLSKPLKKDSPAKRSV